MRSERGDAAADVADRATESVVRRVVTEHDGLVLKGLGDGIIATFAAATQAVAAAAAIQGELPHRGRLQLISNGGHQRQTLTNVRPKALVTGRRSEEPDLRSKETQVLGQRRSRGETLRPFAGRPFDVVVRNERTLGVLLQRLDAQESALLAFAASKGWTGEIVTDAGFSGAKLDRRALTETLVRLDRGDLQALVVTRLDRLTRSVADFAGFADRARARGWAIVCLDVNIDTSTPSGELVANIIASTSQYERRLLSARTIEGLAAKKAAGVRLGRPPVYSPEVVQRVLDLRSEGCSMRLIAELLAASGIPTARGGPWTVSSVQSVLGSERATRATVA